MNLRNLRISLPVASLLCLASCIDNDIPYPHIQQDILTIAAEGESAPADIDDENLTVLLHLGEDVNPRSVRFTEFTISEEGSSSLNLLEGSYDLSKPLTLTLTRFQDYEWTITAQQDIERYVTFAGQIGETAIDVPGRRVVLYVPETADRSALELTSFKLGPEGHTTCSPALEKGQKLNVTEPLEVKVESWGVTETWTIYVDVTEALVTTTQADAWVNVLWVYGAADESAQNGFEYREKGQESWIPVPEAQITRNGGTFSCYIPHVKALTSYEVRATSEENKGNEMTVTTGAAELIPDASFDQWWQNGKVWCPWPKDGTSWWDTGNTGASTLGQSNVTPSTDTPTGQGQSAKLETRFVGIGSIGKLAAGSIFAGSFRKVDGTNGILDFGRPWTARPTRLHGYFKYVTAPVNYASDEFKSLIGKPDACHLWVALIDQDTPYEIRTNPRNRQLFDPTGPSVIAYGELIYDKNTDGWQPFTIELKYYDTSRVPKYVLITTAASHYGDYFTGGTGATLWVDDFSFSYDY